MDENSMSKERLAELRQLIRDKVSSDTVQRRIRQCIDGVEDESIGEQALMELLEEKGLVHEVMAGLELEKKNKTKKDRRGPVERIHSPTKTVGESSNGPERLIEGKSGQFMYLQIIRGHAFIDYINEIETPPTSYFQFHIYYDEQRFVSSPVVASCDPEIHEGFLVKLSNKPSSAHSPQDLMTLPHPIHIIMTSLTPRGDSELMGTCKINWLTVLCCHDNVTNQSIELVGLKADGQVPPGVLNLRWQLLPRQLNYLNRDILEAQCGLEHQRETESKRMFLLYAKQWWKEYLAIRQNHTQRIVKIFAEDETNDSKMVCTFVTSLRAGRLLDGPRHAARFVSLIEHRQVNNVGEGGRKKERTGEVWTRLHSVLATKSGGCEDHAVLLCSLLLGYGLDAFVCLGTKVKGTAHSWVMTINGDGSVVFWESLTAQRFHHSPYDPDSSAGSPVPIPTHPYRTIGCVFNDRSFYANIQPSDNVLTSQYDLRNGTHWKSMSKDAIGAVKQMSGVIPCLTASQMDHEVLSSDLEQELMSIITQHRMDCGLPTTWDRNLGYLLSPSLSSYELERREGVNVGAEEFKDIVTRNVPQGHTFKGFPLQTNHCSAKRIFLICLGSPICSDIINCRGDDVRLSIRVRVWPYPEDLCAVWTMLAVTYRSVL